MLSVAADEHQQSFMQNASRTGIKADLDRIQHLSRSSDVIACYVKMAKRVWEERRRQNTGPSATCHDMWIGEPGGSLAGF